MAKATCPEREGYIKLERRPRMANVDGGERKLVIEGMHQPAFSPDGQWLSVNGERHEHFRRCVVPA
jgi:hypothetical protein